MDTDDLTTMAYECIIYASEATDILKTELGATCSKFKTEDKFLLGILKYIKKIENHPYEYLDEWNLLDEIDINVFKIKLQRIRERIEKTINTPLVDRGDPPFKRREK